MDSDLEQRIDDTEQKFLNFCIDRDIAITGDFRISEKDAALLLYMKPASLKAARHDGRSPDYYNMPMDGAKITYSLRSLAEWVESRKKSL